jgi:hypothetical protein
MLRSQNRKGFASQVTLFPGMAILITTMPVIASWLLGGDIAGRDEKIGRIRPVSRQLPEVYR